MSEIKDEFNGGNAQLVACIGALISLNDDGVLVPHGLGGHGRTLLAACYRRIPALEDTARRQREISRHTYQRSQAATQREVREFAGAYAEAQRKLDEHPEGSLEPAALETLLGNQRTSTPETDAAELDAHVGVTTLDASDVAKAYEFARGLERQRNAARVPICVGRPIIGILARDGQWVSEDSRGVVAASDLFRKDPYAEIEEMKKHCGDRYPDARMLEAWHRLREEHAELRDKYNDLILRVARKFDGETRHQTAARYLDEAEGVRPPAVGVGNPEVPR